MWKSSVFKSKACISCKGTYRYCFTSQIISASGNFHWFFSLWMRDPDKCAGHVVSLKGEENFISKSQKSRNGRNLIAESKGVPGDRESEGSRRQNIVVTHRNRI